MTASTNRRMMRMSEVMTSIACVDCGQERVIKVQDAFQVKRCSPCQTKFRRKLDAQRRKAKRATIGTIWVDADTVVTVTRPAKDSERFTVVGTVPTRWEAVIEDGVDMYMVEGDKSHLPTAIEAVRIFNDGRWGLEYRVEETDTREKFEYKSEEEREQHIQQMEAAGWKVAFRAKYSLKAEFERGE
jgi:hypothetical protein